MFLSSTDGKDDKAKNGILVKRETDSLAVSEQPTAIKVKQEPLSKRFGYFTQEEQLINPIDKNSSVSEDSPFKSTSYKASPDPNHMHEWQWVLQREDKDSLLSKSNQSGIGIGSDREGQGQGDEEEEEESNEFWRLQQKRKATPHSSQQDTISEPNLFMIPSDIYEKLMPHQRDGIRWLWSLFQLKTANAAGVFGGILGDDMGLGKTIQTVVFLYGLFLSGAIERALIIMPLGVLESWKRTFYEWTLNINVVIFHGNSKRDINLVRSHGGICLTTYGSTISFR
jgi:SNF2 family DNA or RNA helicase